MKSLQLRPPIINKLEQKEKAKKIERRRRKKNHTKAYKKKVLKTLRGELRALV
uniref:Uncharacterized protein n=1 Tax=Anguilla anguilla TaxID=7936 RepID=A0A0E9UYJ8_ANGAN